MKLTELITLAREESGDIKNKPYLWSDALWAMYANEAENEACRRARLIVDSSTPEINRFAVTVGKTDYELDKRIIFIRRVKLADRSLPLEKVSYKTLDEQSPGWEDETGDPRGYILDFNTGKLRLYPEPESIDVMRLTTIRIPLKPMVLTDANCTPEIKEQYHQSLVYWMLYRAYSKQDEDTKDPAKADKNLAMFEAEFGKKSNAVNETWIEREHGYDGDEGLF